jgi:tetratricopeptide (TPR) repeat protein
MIRARTGIRRVANLCLLLAIATSGTLAQLPPGNDTFLFSVFEKKWAVAVDLPGFVVEKNMRTESRRYFFASLRSRGLAVSVTLQKSQEPRTVPQCRDAYLEDLRRNSKLSPQDLRSEEFPNMHVVEFALPSAVPNSPPQRNFVGLLARGDVCVHVEVVKLQYQDGDRPACENLLRSVRFVEDAPPTSFDLMSEASYHYRLGNYGKSIGPYERALALERERRRLDKTLWYVLVDNLGIAYGVTGRVKKAKEHFEWALTQDPDYPLFYYNLACAHGDMNDRENALRYLRLAFERKQNTLLGNRMPDPRFDDSFRRFTKDEGFRRELDELAGYLDFFEFSIAESEWKLVVALPGFQTQLNQATRHRVTGQTGWYFLASHEKSGINASVTIRADSKRATPQGCREEMRSHRDPKREELTDVKEYEYNSIAVLEYTLLTSWPGGGFARQRNLFACDGRDNVYFELHLSKRNPERKDNDTLQRILQSFRLEAKAPPVASAPPTPTRP